MELHACNLPQTLETVTTFGNATFKAGGSAPQTARALSALSISSSVLTVVGDDPHGRTLQSLLTDAGIDPSSIVVDSDVCTSLAVLPLFSDGTRGCFVTLGANVAANISNLLPQRVLDSFSSSSLRVFHFGYPHLMPQLQGHNLRRLFDRVRKAAPNLILTMDVNGANTQESSEAPVLLPALEITAAIHANLEEACVITGLAKPADASHLSARQIRPIVQWFTDHGAAISCITCGKDGVFISTAQLDNPREWAARFRISENLEKGAFLYRPAVKVADGVSVNASGAGDAFTAGVISELATSAGSRGPVRIAEAGIVSALHRLDNTLSGSSPISDIDSLLNRARTRPRLEPRTSLQHEEYLRHP